MGGIEILENIARNINDLDRRVERLEAYEDSVDVLSAYLTLPGLVAFWPMSPVRLDSLTSQCRDLSSMDRNLTNNATATFGYDGLVPYARFASSSSQYFNKADGGAANWADITGAESHIVAGQRGLTLGCWFYTTDATNDMALMGKYGAAGARSYLLYARGDISGDPVRFYISDDGTNTDNVQSSIGYSAGTWMYTAARFNDADSGEEQAIFVNDTKTTDSTARASIFDSATDFTLGSADGGGTPFDGKISMAFLCQMGLSDAIIKQLYQWSRRLFGV